MSQVETGADGTMTHDDLARMSLRVFKDATDPIVIEDLSGGVIEMNRATQKAYGWSREELIGQPIKRLVPEERHTQAESLLQQCLAGEDVRNIEGLRVSRDGTIMDVLLTLSLLRDDSGAPVAVASIAKDISALRRATAEYEDMVRAINNVQAVVEFSLDGTVLSANENFLSIFGYTENEVVGKHHSMFCDIGYAESRDYEAFWNKLGRGESVTGEFRRKSKDGRVIWLQATYNPIYDRNGNPVKCMKFASDITSDVEARSLAMLQMSTPVTAIWRDVLMLPIVGILDSGRARDIMNASLSAIADTQSRVFIMDISGVAVVDTAVANHLIKISKAAGLMGCECTISGVSAVIAQTMVELGIEVGDVKTTSTLQDALASAFRATGTEIRRID